MADSSTLTLPPGGTVRSEAGGFALPPPQRPYDRALQAGFDALRAAPPTPDKLAALGASLVSASVIRLPALGCGLEIDLGRRTVGVEQAGPARPVWAVLAVHYLIAADVAPDSREVSFSCFPDCQSYLSVFGKRIVGRFLATTGRSTPSFEQAAAQVAGTRLPGPGIRYRFEVMPRVPVVIVRYEGDSEIAPGAGVLYRADAERLLPAEDRVVAAELLLDALGGKPMTETGGRHA